MLGGLPVVAVHSGEASFDVPGVVPDSVPAPTTPTASDSGSSSGSATGGGTATDSSSSGAIGDWNYTRLYVDAENGYLDVKPGESESFTVTVGNREEDPVTVDPHVYVPPTVRDGLDDSWVDRRRDHDLTRRRDGVHHHRRRPGDGRNRPVQRTVAPTDGTIASPGRPPQPVHAAHVGVEVWKEPTVNVLSNTYVHGQVEAGESVTHEIVVENTGSTAVPLSPELARQRDHCYGSGCPARLDPSRITIDAPGEVRAGEIATVTVTTAPAADAPRGRYDTEIDLGLKDPARPERNPYWQQVQLNCVVREQPTEPFETTVDVSERARNFTLTLSPRTARNPGTATDEAQASFDVEFVSPAGGTVDAERVRVFDHGFVDLSGRGRPGATGGDYAVTGGGKQFVYRVADPSAGEWTVRITPHRTTGFNYEFDHREADR